MVQESASERAEDSHRRSPVPVVLCWLLVATILAIGFSTLRPSLGLTGEPGFLKVSNCKEVEGFRGSSSSTHCTGTFWPDNESERQQRDVSMKLGWLGTVHSAGAEVRVVRTGEEEYVATTPNSVARQGAIVFGGFVFLALVGAVLSARRVGAETLDFRQTLTGRTSKYLALFGLAGTLLSLAVMFVTYL